MNRKLSLRREVLAELDDSDLRSVAAGETVQDLSFSCLTYVSCGVIGCLLSNNGPLCLEA